MAHVFISYKRDDDLQNLLFIRLLRYRMKQAELDVWIDEQIQAGETWREAIDTALRTSFAVIVVMTPQAKVSEYVIYEWSYALSRNIPIIPLIREPVTLPARLEVLQHLDFTIEDQPWELLINRLQQIQHRSEQTVTQPQYSPFDIAVFLNKADALSDLIFETLSELYLKVDKVDVTPEQIINTFALKGILNHERQNQLLAMIEANRRKRN